MESLLQAEHLVKYFKTNAGKVKAVDDVSFTIYKGETLALVGESGCGKSTLGRLILNLIKPTSGRVLMEGTDLSKLNGHAMRKMRSDIQIIFQDPFS